MNRFGLKFFLVFVLGAFLVLPCLGQEPDSTEEEQKEQIEAEPVVVTVSSQAIPLSAASASVTVITREFIENSRTETVAELLRWFRF